MSDLRSTTSPKPSDADARLAALDSYAILDTPPERGFDDITRLAAQFCEAPIGLITFVDNARQFFKARVGSEGEANSPLDVGFCPVVVQRGRTVIIPDTTADPTFAGNAAVQKGGVRFYAGAALLTAEGFAIGTLCVLDTKPRPEGLTLEQLSALEALSREVMARLELRRESAAQARTAEAARESEQRLRMIVEAATDYAILTTDGARTVTSWSAGAAQVFGYPADAIIGRSADVLFTPEDQAVGQPGHEIETARADGRAPDVRWHQHRDGSRVFLNGSMHLLRDAGGQEIGFLKIARDETERRASDLALKDLNINLEERVATRTRELLTAEEALRQSQKMEAVGQLTGGVAHDFNNLLTIIRSSVDFLRRPDLAEERKKRYLDAVSDTVDRAAKLTGQLLAFARRQALKPEVFDVGQRVRGVADMLDTVTGARIRVVTEAPQAPCFIRADISQFETALVNMAVNARDAMAGEGTLTLRLVCGVPMPTIRGHAGSAMPFSAVSLTDTGTGISAETLLRIFEPFFTTKEVGKGTGLGLSQVFGFAKQSGGDVDVASVPGEGTTFTLYLPETEADGLPAGAADQPGEASPLGTGECILVVEDNIEVGRFATQILEDLGYKTAWAANAEEALDRLGPDGAGFNAVFSDVVMPGMGGVALAKILRQRLPDLPVVLTSGYSHVLAQEGAHGFELLQKPYSAEQLSRILRKVVAVE